MEELQKEGLAKSEANRREIAGERHSAWLAECREVLRRRDETLRHSMHARLTNLKAESSDDARGWGVMTVIDSSVADTMVDSDVEVEPQAVAATLLDED